MKVVVNVYAMPQKENKFCCTDECLLELRVVKEFSVSALSVLSAKQALKAAYKRNVETTGKGGYTKTVNNVEIASYSNNVVQTIVTLL